MDELLAKYMLGETSAEENQLIDEWVKTSEANLKYFNHFKLIWDTSKSLKIESKLNVDESWAEFKQLTANNKPSAKVRSINTSRWMRIAATWLVLFGAAGLLYTVLKPSAPQMLTVWANKDVLKHTLPDGSVLTLNKHTLVTYPDKFTGDTREITLNKGEAFFDIATNKSKPFLIHVQDAVVRVVGTSFNIKTDDAKAEVIVETGIVQVIKQKVVVKLKPNEKADIDHKSGTVKKGVNTDRLYNYYRTSHIIADKTPLWRVVEVLNDAYGVNILIANKAIVNRPLTTTLVIGSLDENLQIIKETYNLQVIRKANKIIIQ